MQECRAEGVGAAEVRTVSGATPRLEGDESHCATLKLGVRLRVASDYLHIARGPPEPLNLPLIAQHLKHVRGGFNARLEAVSRAARLLGGLVNVKYMYRCGGRPCIPGSTLKGAVRARIELGSLGSQAGGSVLAGMLYDSGPLKSLPQPGSHGWRHARIWCESVFEERRRHGLSVLEDLVGVAGKEVSLGSRVYFSSAPASSSAGTVILKLDHNEVVEAVPQGTVFDGEVLLANASLEDLGLVLYGLGLDKRYLCNGQARILLGASKYRARKVAERLDPQRGAWVAVEQNACFGAVEVEVTRVEYAPWSRCKWGVDAHELARTALEKARQAYPELRLCYDEVARRDGLAGCV